MEKFFTRSYLILLLLISITACDVVEDWDRIKTPNWQPSLALPLSNTQIRIQDILSALDSVEVIQTDNEGLISLIYETDLLAVEGGNLMDFPDVNFPMLDTVQSVPIMQESLSSIKFKAGSLTYDFNASQSGEQELIITASNVIKDGMLLRAVIPFTGPGTFSGGINLNGYTLELTDGTLDISYQARQKSSGTHNDLDGLVIGVKNVEYTWLEGKLDRYEFEAASDSLTLDLMSDFLEEGSIRFVEPILDIRLHNSYGLPVEIKAPVFELETPSGPLTLEYQPLTDGVILEYPEPNQKGTSKTTLLSLNNSNSNLVDILAAKPTGIRYQIEATANPDTNAQVTGFALDSSKFSAEMRIEAPLNIQMKDIRVSRSQSLDPSALDPFKSADLMLILENGLPLEVAVQAHFYDSQGMLKDSLFAEPTRILAASQVNSQGRATLPATEKVEIKLNAEKLEHVRQSTEIVITAWISTQDNGNVPVKFYTDYGLGIKLGIKAGI